MPIIAPEHLRWLKLGRLDELKEALATRPIDQLDLGELKLLLACQLQRRSVGSPIESPGFEAAGRLCQLEPDAIENWSVLLRMWLDAPAAQAVGSASLRQIIASYRSIDAGNPEALYALGMLEQALGHERLAAEVYLQVLERAPTHAAAQFRLWSMGIERTPTLDASDVPDLSRGSWSEGFHSLTRGALLRDVIDQKSLEDVLPEARQFCENCYEERGQTPNFAWAPQHLQSALSEIIRGQVVARVQGHVSRFAAKGYTPLAHDQWHVQLHRPGKTKPVSLHSDHPVHSQQNDWTTFWIPFTAAGRGIAPSVRLLTVPLDHGLIPVEWRTCVMNEIRSTQVAEFFGEHFRDISVNPGDVLAFGRFVQHSTFVEPTMKSERVSCDVRFRTGPAGFGAALAPDEEGTRAPRSGPGYAPHEVVRHPVQNLSRHHAVTDATPRPARPYT